MKHSLLFPFIFFSLASLAFGQETDPFSLTYFGHYKKMVDIKKNTGVINLQKAISLPHVYAVGATARGTGEITVIDSKLWLDYGADGLGNAGGTVSADEEAVLLVRAQVEEWLKIKVPKNMQTSELHVFILSQAKSHGIDIEKPFPFMLDGNLFNVDWHVINGPKSTTHGGHKGGGIFKKIKEHRDETKATVIGFYSAANQGVFTHPGESWHLHVLYDQEKKAGHLDAYAIQKGAILKLPQQ